MASRVERAAEAARLRAEGLTQQQVAERMSISRSYASALLSDPDGTAELVRRRQYRRPCPDCGRMMNGGDGRGPNAPRWCAHCAPRHQEKVRTPDEILGLIRRWAAEHGRPPAVHDWSKPHAAQQLRRSDVAWSPGKRAELEAALADTATYPAPATVAASFGSWEKAIRAAGFTPRMRERLTDRELLDMIRQAADNGTGPSCTRLPFHKTASKRFGSWRAAVEAAGLVYVDRRGRHPRSARRLARLSSAGGQEPT